MSKSKLFSRKLKGQAAVVVIIIIVIVALVIFFAPGILPGGGLGGLRPGGVGSGTQGVVITNFFSESPEVDAGQDNRFIVEVKNNGGAIARNVEADIFGLEEWTGFRVSDRFDLTELREEDPSHGLIGDTDSQEWEATAPRLRTDLVFPITARVKYKYDTQANIQIRLIGRDYARTQSPTSQTTITQSQILSTTNTAGPLMIITKGRVPLVSSTTRTVTLTFEIVNTGGGKVFDGNLRDGLNRLRIARAQGCTLDQTSLKLINERKTITCELTGVTIDTEETEIKTVTLDLEYDYVVESTRQVRVLREIPQ